MSEITYRLLTDSDFPSLYRAFQSAFSDYYVEMRASSEQFAHRLLRDRVKLNLSVGAFYKNELIGFCINGYGSWRGHETAYNAGTGVISQHRRKGIGEELVRFGLPHLKRFGSSQYLLEVLTENAPAVALYRKLGFTTTRMLGVFRSETRIAQPEQKPPVEIREVRTPNWAVLQTFWDSYPSWQNSVAALERTKAENLLLAAFNEGECVGYAAAARQSGSLIQFAVAPSQRRRGIGSLLLASLQERVVTGEPLKVNNVDYGLKDVFTFLETLSYKLALRQYEMTKQL